jgi:hypothetical protein
MTNEEMIGLLVRDTKFNKARRIISGTYALISVRTANGGDLVETRKMEFEAVEKILALYGIDAKKE